MERRPSTIQASRRAIVSQGSRGDPETVVPTAWEKLIANHPCRVIGGTLLAVFVLIGVLLAAGFPKFSNGGFSALNSQTQLGIDALEELHTMGRGQNEAVEGAEKDVCRPIKEASKGCEDMLNALPEGDRQNPPNRADADQIAACFERYVDACNAESKCVASRQFNGAEGQKFLAGFECAVDFETIVDSTPHHGRRLLNESEFKTCEEEATQDIRASTLFYEAADGGNMLTEENLLALCEFERKVLMEVGDGKLKDRCLKVLPCACPRTGSVDTTYPSMCAQAGHQCSNVIGSSGNLRPLTVTTPATALTEKLAIFESDPSTCKLVADWQANLLTLAAVNDDEEAWAAKHAPRGDRRFTSSVKQYVNFVLDKDFSATANRTGTVVSSVLRSKMYYMKPRDSDSDEEPHKYMPELLDPLGHTSGPIKFYYQDDDYMQKQMNKDMRFAILSIAFVLLYMWFKTASMLLTLVGLLEMLLSFPLAFFVWKVVLGRQYFVTLQMMALFIILGIGADDIFVLMDAYTQSKAQPESISGSRETRFAWAYRRASNAMTVTSFTTFMAFIAAAMTPVPAIQAFGIFAAFVVLFDFILVITLFAAAMMWYEQSGYCLDSGGNAPGGTPRNCFLAYFCDRPPPPAAGDHKELDVEALGSVERAFFNHANKLRACAKPILALFLMLAAYCSYLYLEVLQPATRLGDFFPPDNPMTRFKKIAESGFAATETDPKFTVSVVWGVDRDTPLDRGSIDTLAPPTEDGGKRSDGAPQPTVMFDASWGSDARQREMQEQMLKVCENAFDYQPKHVKAAASLVASYENATTFALVPQQYCWITELKAYRTQFGKPFPVPNGTDLTFDLTADSHLYRAMGKSVTTGDDGFREWLRNKYSKETEGQGGGSGSEEDEGGFRAQTDYSQRSAKGGFSIARDAATGKPYVRAAWQSFDSTMRYGRDPPTDLLQLHFDDWRAFLEEQGAEAYQTHEVYGWLETVTALTTSANKGIVGSLGLAWVVLIVSTSNFLVSVMAMSSIIGIMVTCFGIMALAGWTISILESICLIIVVGMAVDYTVHLMHSYNEAGAGDRFGKAQAALAEMGVSVTSGAVTTMMAALPLLLAQFKFFTQFGSFIAIVTFCSILWAIFYLMTLAMVVGPEGEELLWCDIPCVKYWMRCKKVPEPSSRRLIENDGGTGDGGAGDVEMGSTTVAQSAAAKNEDESQKEGGSKTIL